MYSENCVITQTSDTVGRAYLAAFGFHAEYTSLFDGNPLSIASFIGSQEPSSIVTIEKNDEAPFLYTVGCREQKCTDETQCPSIKKYLRYIRRVVRKKGESLTYEEAEQILKKRFKELSHYPSQASI